ncbi:MAG: hypothetical protein KF869_15865 [Phycisphaeraceae bacterium]|nr:hypothetical protein [Phycisphaeraceae bacterium]
MTRADLFRLLLVAADAPGSLFDHAEVSRWPKGALDDLLRSHLVRPAQTGLTAPCPHCDDGHVETVTVVQSLDDTEKPRYFICCPESLKVEIDEAMCRGWAVDLDGLGAALASALAVSTPKPVVPGRFWRLGRMQLRDTTREVVFAVRLAEDDADALMRHVGTGGRAVVFVPHRLPDRSRWPGRAPAVISLHDVAALVDDNVVLDPQAVIEAIDIADKRAEARGEVPEEKLTAKRLERGVRKVIENMVSDDALVQAYVTHGSYRKAADALVREGQITDRWAVERAVKAKGGPKAVRRETDSGSVSRAVASQSRDRAKKFDQYRK